MFGGGGSPLESLGQNLGLNDAPLIGGTGLFGPSSEERRLQAALKRAQAQQQAYRPLAAQAHMQGLGNIASFYGTPVSQVLQQMYGPSFGFSTSPLMQSPITPQMLALGGPGRAGMPQQSAPGRPMPTGQPRGPLATMQGR